MYEGLNYFYAIYDYLIKKIIHKELPKRRG